MVEFLLPVVALLTGAIGLGRLRDLRPGAEPGRRAVAVAVWGIAVAATFLTPGVIAGVAGLTGVANIDEPLARTALMVSASGAQALFLLAAPDGSGPRRVARRRLVVGLGVLALWAAFACAPRYGPSGTYYLRYGTNPWVSVMLLVALTFLGWCFADLLIAWRRFGRRTRGAVHAGLALMAIGALTGLGWVSVRVGGQVAVLTRHDGLRQLSVAPGVVLAALTAVLTVTGVVWPSLQTRAGRLGIWWQAYRSQERLYPLWRGLLRVRPAVALEPDPGPVRERLHVRNVRWRLYRRVIEIRDARLALRPFLPASRTRARARLRAEATTTSSPGAAPPPAPAPVPALAAVEGYALADAVHTAQTHPHQVPAPPAGQASATAPAQDEVPSAASLAGEVAYLSEVALHYERARADPPTTTTAMPDGPRDVQEHS